jgi:hypothetical protein
LVRVLLEQCQRPHREYRWAAIMSLTQLAQAFPGVDVMATVEPTLRGLAGMGTEAAEPVADLVAKARAIEALGAFFPVAVSGRGGSGETNGLASG